MNIHSPPLPAFEPDLEDNPSPTQSPLTYSYDLVCEGDRPTSVPLLHETTSATDICTSVSPYVHVDSTYSSLRGWAGDIYAKCSSFGFDSLSPTYVVASSQPPMVYSPDNVMKDAFAAAADAPFEDWGILRSSGRLTCASDIDGLHHYAQGWQDLTGRQGNSCQLF